MSDTWDQLQAHKRKHENLKERLAKRRKERQGIIEAPVAVETTTPSVSNVTEPKPTPVVDGNKKQDEKKSK